MPQTRVAHLWIGILIPFLCLAAVMYQDAEIMAGSYSDSAHGNTAYGINRSATATEGYTRGHCGHCHEQHASMNGEEPAPAGGSPSPYAIFSNNFTSQTEDFCFDCHKGVGSVQTSFSRSNYNYSYRAGGDDVHHLAPSNIYDTFNPASGSAHNLQDILTFVKTKWPETFKDESNPCNACHNPHLSTREYPIVRPTDRNNIWGDSAGEHMSDYAAAHGVQYQAPARVGGGYEPDGSPTTDGSNLPDYATFCSDCHNATNVVYSSTLARNLRYIDWSRMNRGHPPGDVHGGVIRCYSVDGNPTWGSLKEPYYTANYNNFITCCTDCHEPHGAINGSLYMLRQTVNGRYWSTWANGRELCKCCHNWASHCGGADGNCMDCHFHNAHATCWGCSPQPCGTCAGPGCYQWHTF